MITNNRAYRFTDRCPHCGAESPSQPYAAMIELAAGLPPSEPMVEVECGNQFCRRWYTIDAGWYQRAVPA